MSRQKILIQKQMYIQNQKEEHNLFEDRDTHHFSASFQELVLATEESTQTIEKKETKEQQYSGVPNNLPTTNQLTWYNFPQSELVELIEITRAGAQLSEASLEFVIYSLNYSKLRFPLANPPLFRSLALKILTYHAKNKGYIGIERVVEIFSRLDALNTAPDRMFFLLFLSYIVINGEVLKEDQKVIFLKQFALLMQQPSAYLPALIIALHAKILLNPQETLKDNEWLIVNCFLHPTLGKKESSIEQPKQLVQLYKLNGSKKDYPKTDFFQWHELYLTEWKKLEAIYKKITDTISQDLTESALKCIIDNWNQGNDKDVFFKPLILDIIWVALSKRQLQFPKSHDLHRKLITILRESLANKNIELQIKSLTIYFKLAMNDSLEGLYSKINDENMQRALEDYQLHALYIITEHYRLHSEASSAFINDSIHYIEVLRSSAWSKVRENARYLYAVCTKEMKGLSSLIETNDCVRVTGLYVEAVKRGHRLSPKIIDKLISLLSHAEQYSSEAIKNVAIILQYVAKNKQTIPDQHYPFLRKMFLISQEKHEKWYDMQDILLLFMGYYVSVDHQLIHDIEVITKISSLLDIKNDIAIITNITFICAQLLEVSPELISEKIKLLLSSCLENATKYLLDSVNFNNDGCVNILTLLYRTVQKKLPLSSRAVHTIFLLLTKAGIDNHHILKLLFLISHSFVIDQDIVLKDSEIDILITLLSHADPAVLADAGAAICSYINISKNKFFPATIITNLEKLHQGATQDVLLKILHTMSEREWILSNKAIDILINNIRHDNQHIALDTLDVLLQQVQVKTFTIDAIDKIVKILQQSNHSDTVKKLLVIFTSTAKKIQPELYIFVFKESIQHTIAAIAVQKNHPLELRKKALALLIIFSNKSIVLAPDVVNQIFTIISEQQDPSLFYSVLLIIHLQVLQVNNCNNWLLIEKIECLLLQNFFCKDNYLKIAIDIIREAHHKNYKIKSNNFTDFLADIMLFNHNDTLTTMTYAFLKSLRSSPHFSNKSTSIIELEEAALSLDNDGIFNKLRSFIFDSKLKSVVEKYGYATTRNLKLLAKLIKNVNQDPRKGECALGICYILACKKASLPHYLWNTIFNYMLTDAKLNRLAMLTLLEVCKYDRIVHEDIFLFIEDKYKNNCIEMAVALEAFHIAVNHNIKLQQATIKRIAALTHDPQVPFALRCQAISIIKEASKEDICSSLDNLLQAASAQFNDQLSNENLDNVYYCIHTAISKAPHLLDERKTELLLGCIVKLDNAPVVKKRILELIRKCKPILFKEKKLELQAYELDIKLESTSDEMKGVALRELISFHTKLSLAIYRSLIQWISKVDQNEIMVKNILVLFNKIHDYQNWPEDLTRWTIHHFNNHVEEGNSLLTTLINHNISICSGGLEQLQQYCLFDINSTVRVTAYHLLMKIQQYQNINQTLVFIIQLEAISDVNEALKRFQEYVKIQPELPLSINKASLLIHHINACQTAAALKDIISFMSLYREKVPFILISELLGALISIESTHGLIDSIEAIFKAAFLKISYQEEVVKEVLHQLYRRFEKNHGREMHIKFLFVVSQSTPLPINQLVFKSLISEAMKQEDFSQKNDILSLLLNMLQQNPTINEQPLLNGATALLFNLWSDELSVASAIKMSRLLYLGLQHDDLSLISNDTISSMINTFLQYIQKKLEMNPIVVQEIVNISALNEKMSLLLILIASHVTPNETFSHGVATINIQPMDFYGKRFITEAILENCHRLVKTTVYQEDTFFNHLHAVEQKLGYHDDYERGNRFLLRLMLLSEQEKLPLLTINSILALIQRDTNFPFETLMIDAHALIPYRVSKLVNRICPDKSDYLYWHTMICTTFKSLHWEFFIAHTFLDNINHITSLNELNVILTFLLDKKFDVTFLENTLECTAVLKSKISGVDELCYLQTALLDQFIKKIIKLNKPQNNTIVECDTSEVIVDVLPKYLCQLMVRKWSFVGLYDFLEKKLPPEMVGVFLKKMEMVYSYDIKEEVFYQMFFKDALSLYHETRKNIFSATSSDKSLITLLQEIEENNKDNVALLKLCEENSLMDLVHGITREYYSYSYEFTYPSCHDTSEAILRPLTINKWEKSDIAQWSKKFKLYSQPGELRQEVLVKLAIIQRACILHFEYWPSVTQLLSVLLFCFKHSEKKGRFLQIPTGTGKTTIIAMLTTLLALHNEKVDVITSSSELALRDAESLAVFYKLFGLSSACNIDQTYEKGEKACYTCDIVYGDGSSFQFDELRDKFSLLGTRGKRAYQTAIIDEADHFVIDELTKVAMIAESVPGMGELRLIFIAMWSYLLRLEKTYLGKNTLSMNELIRINDEKKALIEKDLLDYINQLTPTSSNKGKLSSEANHMQVNDVLEIDIPAHLITYFHLQKEKWGRSALLARYHYFLDHQYVIREDRMQNLIIAPVDDSTGIIQLSTTWNDGLQQFLQIKHSLKFIPPSLTTNFLSNQAFLARYQHNIFGLSGTLGAAHTHQLIDRVIDHKNAFHNENALHTVDFISIPSSKNNQLMYLTPILADTDETWLCLIVSSAVREAEMGRVALIICQSIDVTNKINTLLREKSFGGRIYIYAEASIANRQFIGSLFDSNTIIIATNLAGRGTDIKLTQRVIEKGGLHLCKTFLSKDRRSDQQADGRVGRRGEPGTIQYIVSNPQIDAVFHIKNATFSEMIKIRDDNEKASFQHIIDVELPYIRKNDTLFSIFCDLLSELHQKHLEKNLMEICLDKANISYHNKLTKLVRGKKYDYERASAIEHWAMWLLEHAASPTAWNTFSEFKQKIVSQYNEEKLINNYYYYLQLGNLSLQKNTFLLKYLQNWDDEAANYYKKAAALEPNCYLAYYYLACAEVKKVQNALGTRMLQTFENSENAREKIFEYKQQANQNLACCYELLHNTFLGQQQTALMLVNDCNTTGILQKNGLQQQIQVDLQIMEYLSHSIKHLKDILNESLKLIDVKVYTNESIITYRKMMTQAFHSIIGVYKDQPYLFDIALHDLKSRHDLITHYQSLETLKVIHQPSVHLILANDNREMIGWYHLLIALLPINRYKDNQKREITEQSATIEVPRCQLELEKTNKKKLSSLLPDGYIAGKTIKTYDSFFDAVAQGINQLPDRQICTIKSLRALCYDYAINTERNHWVKKMVEKDNKNYQSYLTYLQHTSADITNNNKTFDQHLMIAGRVNIEGKMLCAQLKIKLHIIEITHVSNDYKVTELLVTAETVEKIQPLRREQYDEEGMLHIIVHDLHFVPLLCDITPYLRKGERYLYKVGTALSEGFSNVTESVSKAFSKAEEWVAEKKNDIKDYVYDYKEYEALSPTLRLRNMGVVEANHLMKEIKKSNIQNTTRHHLVIRMRHHFDNLATINKLMIKQSDLLCQSYYSTIIDSGSYFGRIKKELDFTLVNPTGKKDTTSGGYYDWSFSNISLDKVQNLFKDLQKHQLEVKWIFSNLLQLDADTILNILIKNKMNAKVTMRFNNISHQAVKKMVYLIDDKYKKYRIQVPQLSGKEATSLVTQASRKQEHFSVNVLPVDKKLLELNIPLTYSTDWMDKGLFGFYDFIENQPIPWLSVSLLVTLSLIQIAGGVALTMTTANPLGIDITISGIRDALRGFQVVYAREFHLDSYLLEKTIYYTLSLITCGIDKAIKSAQAVKEATETTVIANTSLDSINKLDELVHNMGQMALANVDKIDNAIMITRDVTSATSRISILTGKQTLTKAVTQGALKVSTDVLKEASSAVIDAGNQWFNQQYGILIKEQITNELRRRFKSRGDLCLKLQRLFGLEKYLPTVNYTKRLLLEAGKLVDGGKASFIDDKCLDPRLFNQFEADFMQYLENFEIHSLEKALELKLTEQVSAESVTKLCLFLREQSIIEENRIIAIEALKLDTLKLRALYRPILITLNQVGEVFIKACQEYYLVMAEENEHRMADLSAVIAGLFIKRLSESFSQMMGLAVEAIKIIPAVSIDSLNNTLAFGGVNQSVKHAYHFSHMRPYLSSKHLVARPFLSNFYNAFTQKSLRFITSTSSHLVHAQAMQTLRAKFNQEVYAIKLLQWELQEKDKEARVKIMGQYARLTKLAIATLIVDKLDKVVEGDKSNEVNLVHYADKIFENLLLNPSHISYSDILAGQSTVNDEQILETINHLLTSYKNAKQEIYKMEQALELIRDPNASQLITSIAGQMKEYAHNKNLSAVDRRFAEGKMSPAAYMATTMVGSISDYLKMSQQNEAQLTTMIQEVSTAVIASANQIIGQAQILSKERAELVKSINDKCNTLIKEATDKAQEENVKLLQTQMLDIQMVQLLSSSPDALKEYVKGQQEARIKALENVHGILKTATDAASKQAENLVRVAEHVVGGEAAFYDQCIKFYQDMMTRALTTLDKVRESNVGIVKQLITEGAAIAKDVVKARIEEGKYSNPAQENGNKPNTSHISSVTVEELPSNNNNNNNNQISLQNNTSGVPPLQPTSTQQVVYYPPLLSQQQMPQQLQWVGVPQQQVWSSQFVNQSPMPGYVPQQMVPQSYPAAGFFQPAPSSQPMFQGQSIGINQQQPGPQGQFVNQVPLGYIPHQVAPQSQSSPATFFQPAPSSQQGSSGHWIDPNQQQVSQNPFPN